MIRPARFIDVKRMVELLVEQHPRTIYARHGEVDLDYARKLLAAMVQRHGGIHNGGTCVFVAESREEVIQGFVAGQLSPVYHVGTRLMAQDVFLVCGENADPRAAMRLLNAYVDWAAPNPKVLEIFTSHLDVTPESERSGVLFQRAGFQQCGAVFRRFVNTEQQRIAA